MIIAIERADGGVSIMHLHDGAEVEKNVAKLEQVGIEAVSWREIKPADIPEDRTFRDAWKPDFVVDMAKARTIHMGRIRVVRDKELARLDIEQLKGRDVAAEKQTLRDLPQTFDLSGASTPDDLKALWPKELPKS